MTNVFQIRIPIKLFKIVFLLSLVGLSFSCKKNQLGGTATIKGVVKHHAKLIGNATIFIKFNAKEFPGTDESIYDEKVTANALGEFEIKCYQGNYYLFGSGIDNQVLINGGKVIGGIPVKIRNNENLDLIVAVTEGD